MSFSLRLLPAALLLAAPLPAGAQAVPPVTAAEAAQVKALIAKAAAAIKPDQPVLVQDLLGFAPYQAKLEYRQAATNAALHKQEAEFFYVLEGSGTLTLGGELVNATDPDTANRSGSGISGGTARPVHAGDVLVVAEGTPHWFNQVDGRLVMIALKVPRPVPSGDAIVEGFRQVETGSVADAIEQLYGQQTYMSFEMRPIGGTHFSGRAVTVQLRREEHKEGSKASAAMVDLIDTSAPGAVFVMALEDGRNFAGVGGLMTTAMKARGFVGAVIDGGVRDVAQIEKIGFPVFSRSIVPSTTIGHYRAVATNQPVVAGGVRVEAGDIIVADIDGVVVVPQAKAAEVLAKARELNLAKDATLPYIEKFKSLRQAVAAFGRL